MSNLYYSSPTDVEAGAKVRSVDINSIDAAIDAAFDKLPTETNIKQGKINYAVTGGSANAYTVSLPHAPASYTDGLLVEAYIHTNNTGASTVNVNGLGAKSVKLQNGDDPAAGDLQKFVSMRYSTTTGFFHCQANSSVASASATASALLASQWASTTGALVASTDYSAKEWAQGTTATSAKSWATKTSGAVTGSDYSAKEWAIGTQIRGIASGGSAKDWATYTGGTVDGTSYSAKYHAAAAAASAAVAQSGAAFVDTNPVVKGSVDDTKRVRLEVDGLTTATTRVITVPDKDGTLAMTSDLPNVFGTIAVSGQSDVVADSAADTLTLAAGSGITITTNASTDTVTIAASATGVGDHEVVVHTGNGHGSTNTAIRRFTTTLTNVGTAITYADSAANGASFTINEAGLYSIHYTDKRGASALHNVGVSVNSAELTTPVNSIAVANRLAHASGSSATTDAIVLVARVVKLAAGDVVRPHTGGTQVSTTNEVFFAIRKVGTV